VSETSGRKRSLRRLVATGTLGLVALLLVANALAGIALWLGPSVTAPSFDVREVESGLDPRLGRAAAALTGFGVQVWCWSSEDWNKRTTQRARRWKTEKLGPWAGYTVVNPPAIHLSPEICAVLRHLAENDAPIKRYVARDPRAWALFAFAHEAYHAWGVLDEAKASCYGMQSIERSARLLDRTAAEGRRLATLIWEDLYAELRPSYRSSECRNGFELDVRQDTNVWA
jgi:hypothetical protein